MYNRHLQNAGTHREEEEEEEEEEENPKPNNKNKNKANSLNKLGTFSENPSHPLILQNGPHPKSVYSLKLI